jgi:hypothetical protein
MMILQLAKMVYKHFKWKFGFIAHQLVN